MSDLAFIASVAAEQCPVLRDIEMDGPFIALQVIPGAGTRSDVVARDPEVFSARRLQIVPDGAAIGTPELVSRNLHRHRPMMDQSVAGTIGANGPDAVHLMPRSFMTVQQQLGIGR